MFDVNALALDAFKDEDDATALLVVSGQAKSGSGTQRVQCYTVAMDTWTTLPPYPQVVYRSQAVQRPDGVVVVTGGYNGHANVVPATTKTYTLRMRSGCAVESGAVWEAGPSMNTARMLHHTTVDHAGNVFVFGGMAGRGLGAVQSVEVWQAHALAWEPVVVDNNLMPARVLGSKWLVEEAGSSSTPATERRLLAATQPHLLFPTEDGNAGDGYLRLTVNGTWEVAPVSRTSITTQPHFAAAAPRSALSALSSSLAYVYRDGNTGSPLQLVQLREDSNTWTETTVVDGSSSALESLYNPTIITVRDAVYIQGGLDKSSGTLPASRKLYRVDITVDGSSSSSSSASATLHQLASMPDGGQERAGVCGLA